ncbi:MAG: hypothetical protein PF508_00315, partial [Spirochaeta sp.]|nr:hypothetical protein [Spirochaeta sp.]
MNDRYETAPAATATRTARATTASTMRRDRAVRIALLALGLMIVTAALAPSNLFGQTTPEMQQAREETAVVYDLGRFFGYVHGMTTESPSLALTDTQKRKIAGVIEQIREMRRIEPEWAEEQLTYLELELLTPAQLMDVDRRAIEWQNTRESTGQTGSGGGTG